MEHILFSILLSIYFSSVPVTSEVIEEISRNVGGVEYLEEIFI